MTMTDHSRKLLAVTIACFALSWIMVPLRVYVRTAMTSSFGIDDWLMILSQAIFTVLCSFIFVGIHYGMGQHAIDLSMPNFIQAAKYQTFVELLYVAATAFIKLSVGFLLLRIVSSAKTTKYRYFIWISLTIMSLWTTITFFVILFECKPISAAWTGEGKCLPSSSIANAGYAFSAMDILLDWAYALLPIPMLSGVQMSTQVKASVVIILGMGIFASVATIIRLKYIVALTDKSDPLYSLSTALIWTVVEVGVGISAASMATLRPLFRGISGFASSKSRSDRRGADGYQRSYDLSNLGPKEGAPTTRSTTAQNPRTLPADHNDSQESIFEHDRIHKRTDISVVVER